MKQVEYTLDTPPPLTDAQNAKLKQLKMTQDD